MTARGDAPAQSIYLSMQDVTIPEGYSERAVKYILRQAIREEWTIEQLDFTLGSLGLPSVEVLRSRVSAP